MKVFLRQQNFKQYLTQILGRFWGMLLRHLPGKKRAHIITPYNNEYLSVSSELINKRRSFLFFKVLPHFRERVIKLPGFCGLIFVNNFGADAEVGEIFSFTAGSFTRQVIFREYENSPDL